MCVCASLGPIRGVCPPISDPEERAEIVLGTAGAGVSDAASDEDVNWDRDGADDMVIVEFMGDMGDVAVIEPEECGDKFPRATTGGVCDGARRPHCRHANLGCSHAHSGPSTGRRTAMSTSAIVLRSGVVVCDVCTSRSTRCFFGGDIGVVCTEASRFLRRTTDIGSV